MIDYIEAIMDLDKMMRELKHCLLNKQHKEARLIVAKIRLVSSQLDEQIVKQFPETVA